MLINVIRPIPPQALAFIKAHEGCVLKVYADAIGVLTVGYGHVSASLQSGAVITQAEADTFLAQDVATAATRLEAQIGEQAVSQLTDNQYAALLSFVFNLGTGPKPNAAGEWRIWILLRARQFEAAADEFSRFNKAGGKVLSGLVKRRADEQVLFLTGAPQTVDEAPPSSVTRSVSTPPTEAVVKPLSKSKSMIGSCVAACLASASAVAPQIKQGLDGANAAIAPYVGQSTVLQGISSHLAVVAAAAAVIVPGLLWIKNREAKSQ